MSNPNTQQIPALRIEAVSINCILVYVSIYAVNCNLLIIAESLPAHYVEYLLLLRLIILIHLIRRTPEDTIGNRIKKTSKTSGVVVYSFDGLYEIARTPGEGDKHTLYFKGLYGDIFSQMTRNDAQLVTSASKSPNFFELAGLSGVFPFAKGDGFPPNSFVKGFFCEDVAGSCSEYYLNTAKYYWIKGVVEGYTVISRIEFRVGLWVMLIVMLYLLAKTLQKLSLSRNTGMNEEKSQNSLRLCVSVANPILIVSILFTFTNCGIFGGGKKKGDAPWLLLASGINSNTPSVDDTSNGSSTGASGSGGSGGSALVPVVGMYFLHPDHLGSITMITDGRGNVIAGGNNGGKSHIS